MDRIELKDYELAPGRTGNGLSRFSFAIRRGQSCAVHADEPNDVYLFLRALATLVRPKAGTYRFFGHTLDFSDYRQLLPWKKKISYIGRNSAMLSNLTIRENLLLERTYSENSLTIEPSDQVMWFCRTFNLTDKLDLRPAALNPLNLRIAIAIRELTKPSDILIMDGTEDIFGHPKFHYLIERVHSMTAGGIPFVYFSENSDFIRSFSGREVRIDRGVLHRERPEPREGTAGNHGH